MRGLEIARGGSHVWILSAGIRERATPSRRLLIALAAIAVILLVVESTGVDANRNFEATGTTLPGSHKLNRDQPITLKLLPPE